MATPGIATGQQTPKEAIEIEIYLDPKTNTIRVSQERFWVYKSKQQEVKCVCKQPHGHGHNACFLVHFGELEGSPFNEKTFVDDGAHSGCAVVAPSETKFYKYTVWAPGFKTLDPDGGVRP